MTITDEAVEAAAELVDQFTYDIFDAFPTYNDRDQLIRAILEATAQHLLAEAKAEAWDEGWRGGYETHSAKFSLNPYRKKCTE